MSMTLPQIMILNHAAWVNSKRSDERHERKREREKREAEALKKRDEDDPVVWNGKRLSEMNSAEWASYYGDSGSIF